MDKNDIKTHLLTASYGRFDFIPMIISKDVLLFAQPRFIATLLAKELSMDKNDIPIATLRSWLFTFRNKKQKGKNNTKTSLLDSNLNNKKTISFTDDSNSIKVNQFNF